jgi:hypothetical protein
VCGYRLVPAERIKSLSIEGFRDLEIKKFKAFRYTGLGMLCKGRIICGIIVLKLEKIN